MYSAFGRLLRMRARHLCWSLGGRASDFLSSAYLRASRSLRRYKTAERRALLAISSSRQVVLWQASFLLR